MRIRHVVLRPEGVEFFGRQAADNLPNAPLLTEYLQSRKDRKKVEVLFAHMKRILRVNRLRLRSRTGAHDESLLTAIAQNLRRLALTIPISILCGAPG